MLKMIGKAQKSVRKSYPVENMHHAEPIKTNCSPNQWLPHNKSTKQNEIS